MDELAKLLQAIAAIAELGARHVTQRRTIEAMTIRIKELTEEAKRDAPACPPQIERGIPE